jgi:multiple sugar transport system substrate-binding protein
VQPLLDEYASLTMTTIEVHDGDYDDLFTRLNVNLTSATGSYDVVSLDDPWIPLFVDGDFLLALDDLIAETGLTTDDFVPRFLDLGRFPADGDLRALPWNGNLQLFGLRPDVLAELGLAAPVTWADVLQNARAIADARKADQRYGYGLGGAAGSAATNAFLPILRGYGGDLVSTVTWEPLLDEPQALNAMGTLLDLCAQAPPGLEAIDDDTNWRNLRTGRVAQSADIWLDQVLGAIAPSRATIDEPIGIGSEPAQVGVTPQTMTGNWLFAIPKDSKNVDSALNLILWFTAPSQQQRLLLRHGIPPTRLSILRDQELLAQMPQLAIVADRVTDARPRPRTPLYPLVEQIVGHNVSRAIARQLSGAEALERANTEIYDLMVREGELKE